jgi:hypothetical protein
MGFLRSCHNSSSSGFLPGGIILQRVLLHQGSMRYWGYWPSDSSQATPVSLPFLTWMLLLATGIGTRYKEPQLYVSFEGREAIKVKQLAQGCKQMWQ